MGIVLDRLPDPIDFLVDLSTVVVTVLTRARYLELHAGGMPSSDARNFAQAAVSLAREPCAAPPSNDTVVAVAPRSSDHVNHLILTEGVCDFHFLFEKTHDEIDLLLDRASVDLDLFDVCLLPAYLCFRNLCMANSTNHLAVLFGARNL